MQDQLAQALEMATSMLEAQAESGRIPKAMAKMAITFFNEANGPDTAFSHTEAVALTVAFLGTLKPG